MKQFRTLVRAPALTQTGYGVHSRQIISSLLAEPQYDVYLESIPWGMCSFVTDDSDEFNRLRQMSERFLVAKNQGQDKDWDIFISITVPQEFERRGKLNVGITAGTETDRVSHVWLDKSNQMDFIVVPSKHAAKSLRETSIQWSNQQTNQTGILKLEKPLYICPEGYDPAIYRSLQGHELPQNIRQLKFAERFNFLCLGQWGNGGYGDDRKNVANTVLYFFKAFQGRKDVGLVLKTNLARNSEMDYDAVVQRLNQIKANFKGVELPPVYLLHGNFSNEEIAGLYNHPQIDAFVSFTHGEGFGLPLLEAAACGLPIIATNWSAHTEFLTLPGSTQPLFSAVEYDLKEIPAAAVWDPILIKDSRWAVAKEDDAIRRMRKMVTDYDKPKQWADKLSRFVKQYKLKEVERIFAFTLDQMVSNCEALSEPEQVLKQAIDTPDSYNVLYTMPMSAGDVFVSTAVIDGVVKKIKSEHPEADVKLYFATFEPLAGILQGNPNVYKILQWKEYMMNIPMLDGIFDLVLTPNIVTQFTFSNWIRTGQGRLLAEEFANHCQLPTKIITVEERDILTEEIIATHQHIEQTIGDYFIEEDDSIFTDLMNESKGEKDIRIGRYLTIHTGTGKDNWAARRYAEWPEVIANLKYFYPDVKLVQLGSSEEPRLENIDVDLRGRTTFHQLAAVIRRAAAHVSIDTFSMHLAAAMNTPLVAIFGSSHSGSTGPWFKDKEASKAILLEAANKMGCKKACYKYTCKVNEDLPCINEIDSFEITSSLGKLLGAVTREDSDRTYQRIYGKISGYTTSYNAISMGYPFIECIRSMLGFCDEVVVVDHSTDGTWDVLQQIAEQEPRLKVYQQDWDLNNPTMDGDAKAYARALCEFEFCWQQDLDEVVHERDYERIKLFTKRFPTKVDILHLPVVECWGDELHATGRRHSWKWRMSRNKPNITHGVNKHARLTDEKTGQIYAAAGMSDSCEYVDLVTFEPLAHTGFYNQQIELARLNDPEEYERIMNAAIDQMPSVYHYSWFNIENKIHQFKLNWDRQWNVLYQKELPPRFPDVSSSEEIRATAERLRQQGGEDSDPLKYRYRLHQEHPAVMEDWISETKDEKLDKVMDFEQVSQ